MKKLLLATALVMTGVSASADDFCQTMAKYISDDYPEADCFQVVKMSTKNYNTVVNFEDVRAIFGDEQYVHKDRNLEAGVQYYSDFVNAPSIEGKVAVVEDWRTDDNRDNGSREAGIRATDTKTDIEPYVGIRTVIRRPDYDLSYGSGLDPDGLSVGIMGMHDVHESKDSGVALGVAATFDNGALQVGPALEVTGEKYGLAIFPTDLSIVERGGENMTYRKRYSLNPIAILVGELNGQRTALDVLGDMHR